MKVVDLTKPPEFAHVAELHVHDHEAELLFLALRELYDAKTQDARIESDPARARADREDALAVRILAQQLAEVVWPDGPKSGGFPWQT